MEFREDLDFEINFYENLVKDNPDFIDGLNALGHAYSKKGRYQEGLEIDKRLCALKPDDPIVHYNLACSYSLLKIADLSIQALEKAIRLGYREFGYMQQDADLDFIRRDVRYQELLLRYAKKIV